MKWFIPSQRRSVSATRSGISGDPEPLLIKIGPLSSNNDNVPSADDLAQPASIDSSNHNSTTFANVVVAAVATSAKIEIPAKKTIQNSDNKEPVSSVNLHHFDNFSLKRNHNVPGKQTDFCHDF